MAASNPIPTSPKAFSSDDDDDGRKKDKLKLELGESKITFVESLKEETFPDDDTEFANGRLKLEMGDFDSEFVGNFMKDKFDAFAAALPKQSLENGGFKLEREEFVSFTNEKPEVVVANTETLKKKPLARNDKEKFL